jgi:hypothetical protein
MQGVQNTCIYVMAAAKDLFNKILLLTENAMSR